MICKNVYYILYIRNYSIPLIQKSQIEKVRRTILLRNGHTHKIPILFIYLNSANSTQKKSNKRILNISLRPSFTTEKTLLRRKALSTLLYYFIYLHTENEVPCLKVTPCHKKRQKHQRKAPFHKSGKADIEPFFCRDSHHDHIR